MRRSLALIAPLVVLAGCGSAKPVRTVVVQTGGTATTPTATAATAAATGTTAPPPAPGASAAPTGGVPPQQVVLPRGDRLTVNLRRATALRVAPGGRVVARLAAKTQFGSPTVLAVVAKRPGWYGVLSPQIPNGRVGWISARAALVGYANGFSVHASLGHRQVVVRRDGKVLARFPVAIGRPGNGTPPGTYAVTDKLRTGDPATSPYGCCILALSGHQVNVPQDWGGGDRLAIHSTDAPATIGEAASLGCLRAPETVMKLLVQVVPLGTVVKISA